MANPLRSFAGVVRGSLRGVSLLLVLVLLAPAAAAEDTIMLNDGKMYTGTILSETDDYIEIETSVGSIPTTLKLDRGLIVSVVKGHRVWKPPAESDGAAAPAAVDDDSIAVMEIPIVGEFGKDVLPISFRAALDYAARYNVKHIVLRINSPGGSVWAAREILQAMEARRAEFHFHALVESAISAAIWPTFACETIHIAPKGEMGGAVAYRTDGRGNVEVDAKMNSIFAAEIVTVAEALGHNGNVIRAMVLMPSELYCLHDGDAVVLGGTKPSGSVEFETIDGPTTVLTLTSNEAVRLGIARAAKSVAFDDEIAALGVAKPRTIDGSGLMERWASQCDKRRKLAQASAEKLIDAWDRAEAATEIDDAIAALEDFQREHPRFAKYANEFFECFPMDESIDREQVADLTDKVRDAIKELRRMKREGP
jgi:ATP-dependent protease ClpP protease subunit